MAASLPPALQHTKSLPSFVRGYAKYAFLPAARKEPLSPSEAAARAKEAAKDILNLKKHIDKKQWLDVQNDLRLKASYLRYDLNTIIFAKQEEEKGLKDLTDKLFDTIDELEHAAKIKGTPEAEKYYAETKTVLGDFLAKLG